MTINKAAKIMGLEVRKTDTHTFAAYNEHGSKIAEATHRKDTVALTMLVNAVYRQRGLEQMMDDGFRCVRCGELAPLQRHHAKFRSKGRDDTQPMESVCPSCHDRIHKREKSK